MRLSEAEYQQIIARRGPVAAPSPVAVKGVIRQSRSGGPNKTEDRFRLEYLEPWRATGEIDEYGKHESIRLEIANGTRYTPDWPTWKGDKLTFYEIKGPRVWEDSLIKLKVAARQYPRISFYLCKYEGGEWIIQEVLP